MKIKDYRPKLDVQSSKLEMIFNALSFLLIVFLFLFVFYNQRKLPTDIPIHIGKNGIDGWGHSSFLYLLPIVATVMFSGIYFISKKPHLTNFPVTINEENVLEMYRLMKEMMACFNLVIAIGFGILIWDATELAKNNETNMLGAIAFLFIVPLTVLGYYSLVMWQKNREIKKRS